MLFRLPIPTGMLLLVTAVTADQQAVPIPEDPPIEIARGDISGTIKPAKKIKRLYLVSRVTGDRFEPKSFDRKTGRFVFSSLPGNATYDICVQTARDRSIEGIDLDVLDAGMKTLAALRKQQLNIPPERTGHFTEKDAGDILDFIQEFDGFHGYRRVLYLRGCGDRAVVLVELIRTKAFHEGGGKLHTDSMIWRIDIWYFRKRGGGWERQKNAARTLRRVRTLPKTWEKISVEYYPSLSVHIDVEGKSTPVDFAIPPNSDPSRGRPAHSDIKLDTEPHVITVEGR